METVHTEADILRDLGDGLIVRRATVADAESLADFNAEVFRDSREDGPNEFVRAWTLDLMTRPHPTCAARDFTVVENTVTGEIVSSLVLISQTWSYAGFEFGVGQAEMVGTHPDFRGRGLVRAQFEVVHRWSAERGQMVQAILGIPYFYRQFGYEQALEMGGSRKGYRGRVPRLKEGEEEPYRVRPATEADLSFIAWMYERGSERSLVTCVRDDAMWQYEICGRSGDSSECRQLCVVETAEGEPVGFLAHAIRLWESTLWVRMYEVKPGISWLAVTPSVLRYLHNTGEVYAEKDKRQEFHSFAFQLGSQHPVYEAARSWLPHECAPYAWYVRVPDLPRFLRHISPVLEKRLAESVAVGHTGELKLSFYRDGLRLVFDEGRLSSVERWMPTPADRPSAAFPDLTFLRLLFGYHTLEELTSAFPDCRADNDEARALLNALFPKEPSNVWPMV